MQAHPSSRCACAAVAGVKPVGNLVDEHSPDSDDEVRAVPAILLRTKLFAAENKHAPMPRSFARCAVPQVSGFAIYTHPHAKRQRTEEQAAGQNVGQQQATRDGPLRPSLRLLERRVPFTLVLPCACVG